MKKLALCFIFLLLSNIYLYANATDDSDLPLSIFHNFGNNLLGAFTHNYGLNFIGAGLGTWGLIKTGADWGWRNTAQDIPWLVQTGRPMLLIGNLVPVLTPLTFCIVGSISDNRRLQSTAAALSQALLLTLSVQSPLKMITGRASPGLLYASGQDGERSDFSGKFNWFNMDFVRGWPSGHTANAFAAAAVISEMYSDKLLLKIGVYLYAALMGLSVGSSVHWASEVFAGALIGYTIGKTVGRSYARPSVSRPDIEPDISINAIAVHFRI
ncbi:MAG: phosphatase PAP2 family protein [Spirochaetota bacterium]|nr:phosphatase PAP2 family protein [Spirochaetota bacterium]